MRKRLQRSRLPVVSHKLTRYGSGSVKAAMVRGTREEPTNVVVTEPTLAAARTHSERVRHQIVKGFRQGFTQGFRKRIRQQE